MKAKVLIAAFLLVFAATMPVLAQGNGNGGGNSGQNDNGNNGNGNGNGNGQTDTPGKDDNADKGNGNNAGGNGAGERSNSGEVTVVPEEDLLAIVKAGQAVSLASLLPNVQERTGGEIIDAQLVRTERSLIYVVKVMTPDGHVGVEYYNARSGIHIEAR